MHRRHSARRVKFIWVLTGLFLVLVFACKGAKKPAEGDTSSLVKLPDIKQRLVKYAPTEIAYDLNQLNEEDRAVLARLVQAARLIDGIYWKQSYPEGLALKELLEKSTAPEDKDYLQFLLINFGPFDRQDGNKPFIGTETKPLTAGFYPRNLTREHFEAYLKQHPEQREALESPFTVIKVQEGGGLVAVPYSQEYRSDLEPIAKYLREAADLTTNPSLKKYLGQRAADLLSNDYFQSDCDWIDLKDNLVETVIGPYEVYEDGLMNLKASYESFVYVNDVEGMKKIKGYLDYIDEMQRSMPVEAKYKSATVKGLESPLNVVYEIFTAGDTRAGIQTSAFVLPNDERVREKKGSKKVFLKNVMEAKFQKSLVPISQRVLAAEDVPYVSFDAYFNEVILHEIAHVLGVSFITLPDGTQTTPNKTLKEHYSAMEEGKADIAGLYTVRLLMDKGWIPREKKREVYTTYLAGIFRALRFGITESHGRGTLIQFNFLREKEGILYDAATDTWRVNMDTIEDAVKELTAQFLILEGSGNYEETAKFVERYAKLDALTEATFKKLADIPVDIKPIYTAAE